MGQADNLESCILIARFLEIIRRPGTSVMQFYGLLDQTNYSKLVDQFLSLLQVLDCDIALQVGANTASG